MTPDETVRSLATVNGCDVVGRGWCYPLRLDGAGAFVLADGDDDVEQAIRLVLGTAPGERPMRPAFGCAVHDLVFDPLDSALAARAASEVRSSLQMWEPRIDVVDVRTTVDAAVPHVLLVDIAYRIRATNDRRNLVFPFYSIPAE